MGISAMQGHQIAELLEAALNPIEAKQDEEPRSLRCDQSGDRRPPECREVDAFESTAFRTALDRQPDRGTTRDAIDVSLNTRDRNTC